MLTKLVKDYYEKGVIESITRNRHMNNYKPNEINDPDILMQAVLVDFVNYLCSKQWIDLGLYTKDLKK